jgi:acyl-coenzyme A synthetase/AMP-(fatty) acid ligase
MFTVPCEAVFNTHPSVFRSALVGVKKDGDTVPVLCVELERGVRRSERPRVTAELEEIAAGHEHTRSIRHFLFHCGFPVDVRHNAKIDRTKLAVWASRRVRE